ncbi:MAG: hypothetical protein K9N51_01820 [Candidatus Pacebacteria bacterium]|nr:hypothetical protein [Candidatus Paceibacterota bacterium]
MKVAEACMNLLSMKPMAGAATEADSRPCGCVRAVIGLTHSIVARVLAVCVLCLLATGCVHLEQRLVLKTDGSLVAGFHYSIPEDNLPLATTVRRAIDGWQGNATEGGADGLQWPVNEKAARDYFTGNGLALKSYRRFQQNGRLHVTIECTATDAAAAFASGKFGTVTMTHEGAVWKWRMHLATFNDGEDKNAAEAQNTLQALCGGLRLSLVLETPTRVVETSGRREGPKSVKWVFAADDDPAFLRQAPVIEATFDASGLNWEEPDAQ